jgi:transposase-like protein
VSACVRPVGEPMVPVTPRYARLQDRRWLHAEYVVAGRSLRSIAQELGCVPSAVRKALERHGLELRQPGNPGGRRPGELALSDAQLRRRRAAGASITQLARELGVARATVAKRLGRRL